MFQTTKTQIFESNSQLPPYIVKEICGCFRLQRYKLLKAIHNYGRHRDERCRVVSDYKDTNFLKAIYNTMSEEVKVFLFFQIIILSLCFNLNFKFMGIIATLIIGAIAGWLGGTIYKGSGLGLIGNIIIGILGSSVGYWLLGSVLHISLGEGLIGSILTGAIGAIVILFLINLIFKNK